MEARALLPRIKPKHIEKTEESTKTPLKIEIEQGEEVQNTQEMGRASPMLTFSNCHGITVNYHHRPINFFPVRHSDITHVFLHYLCLILTVNWLSIIIIIYINISVNSECA